MCCLFYVIVGVSVPILDLNLKFLATFKKICIYHDRMKLICDGKFC